PELLAARVEALLAKRVRALLPLLQDDEGRDDLAAELVRPPRAACLGDGRVLEARGLDFDRSQPVPGDFDDLVRAAGKPDIPVLVYMGGAARVVHAPHPPPSSPSSPLVLP